MIGANTKDAVMGEGVPLANRWAAAADNSGRV